MSSLVIELRYCCKENKKGKIFLKKWGWTKLVDCTLCLNHNETTKCMNVEIYVNET